MMLFVGFEGLLLVLGDWGRRRSGCSERCTFEMKAEEGVAEEVVEGCPGAIPVIGELGMRAITGDAVLFPLGDVDF